MLAPNWLDAVIQANLQDGAIAIARAIANSPAFVTAIATGLSRPVDGKGQPGPSQAQAVREEIQRIICS